MAPRRARGSTPPQRTPAGSFACAADPTGGNIPGIDTIVVRSSDVYVGDDFSSIGG
jgi:hypothetical protein